MRLLDINLGLMLDKSHTSAERRWLQVLAALGNPTHIRWEGDAYRLVQDLCFDATSPASVVNCIVAARENARVAGHHLCVDFHDAVHNFKPGHAL